MKGEGKQGNRKRERTINGKKKKINEKEWRSKTAKEKEQYMKHKSNGKGRGKINEKRNRVRTWEKV